MGKAHMFRNSFSAAVHLVFLSVFSTTKIEMGHQNRQAVEYAKDVVTIEDSMIDAFSN